MIDRNEQQFTGSIPQHYDQELGPVLFEDFAEEMAQRAAAFEPARLLELSAGTGIVSRKLRNHLAAASALTVSDLNAPMLEVAREKFQDDEAVTFEVADALDLPFADASFDVVVSQFGAMFYPDKRQAFAEAFRVLTPGGRFLFSVWDAHQFNTPGQIAHGIVAKVFPEDPPQFLAIPYSYTYEDAKAPLLAAGFEDLAAATSRLEKQNVDLRSLARGFVHGNPVGDQIKARGTVELDSVVEMIDSGFQDAFGKTGSVPLQATFIAARKPR